MPITRDKIHCAICGSISNRTLDLDKLEDKQTVINDVLEIVELLK